MDMAENTGNHHLFEYGWHIHIPIISQKQGIHTQGNYQLNYNTHAHRPTQERHQTRFSRESTTQHNHQEQEYTG
jgi:hypothetical protein